MMAVAHPKAGLRPYLPADTALLAQIFRASVAELTADDYTDAQREAWASAADDEQAFASGLQKQLTLIGTLNGSPVGFISLEEPGRIAMFYVHPAAAGQGVGTMLYDAIEKLAGARGVASLTVEASDSASEFFRQRGFAAQQRNTVLRGDEWLANTTMEKKLTPKGAAHGTA